VRSHAPLEAAPLARPTAASAPGRRKPLGALAVVALAALAGCTLDLGHLDVVTTHEVDPTTLVPPATLGPPVRAQSCVWVVTVVPVTSLPNLGAAVDRALAERHADALYDMHVRYTIVYLPPGIGRACYVAEGRTP